MPLEQAIFDDPDDREAWQVYGDWLQQQEDPRGELILLDLAEGISAAELEARRAAILAEHRERLLGPLANVLGDPALDQALELEWSRGYIVRVKVGCSDEDYEGPPIPELVTALVQSPATRFLRSLWIGTSFDEDEDWLGLMETNLAAATGAGPLPALTELTIADTEGYWDISSTRVGDIGAALRAAPRLRSLKVVGGEISLEPTTHAALCSLTIETGGLPTDTTRAVVESSFPALTELSIYLGDEQYGGTSTLADLDGLWSGERLPSLEHLGLADAAYQNEIAAALAASPILDRLRSVDLSLGTMTDEGVAAIVGAASRFARLERLDVRENFLTPEGIERLRAALPGVDVQAGDQKDSRGWGGRIRYYVSVGE